MQQNYRGANPFQCARRVGAIAGAIALLAHPTHARAAMQNTWQFDPATDRLELILDETITPLYYIETAPPRIIIDLPEANLAPATVEPSPSNLIRRISVASSPTGGDRIVLELAPEIILAPQQVQLQKIIPPDGNPRWLLYPSIVSSAIAERSRDDTARPVTVNVPPPPSTAPTQPTPTIEFGQPLPKSLAP
ncbi:MAG: AMIN domain-containing protein [Cyanobacteriota bacterium]|nr:AMIN domain-containing protein [Cyanobacteriota bacterium]